MKALEVFKYCNEYELDDIVSHLNRFGERYAERFLPEVICSHIKLSRSLSKELPVKTIVEFDERGVVDVTVIGFDFPFIFSLITGVLSSMGLNISGGEIFTERKDLKNKNRLIVDRFKGVLERPIGFIEWQKRLEEELRKVYEKLSVGGEGIEAKKYVNEMVAASLSSFNYEKSAVLYPIEIEFSVDDRFTRMFVKTEDTPFFLYAMSSALSMQGISIENVSIKTLKGRIEDEFQFVGLDGRRVEGTERLDRIKFSVLLTKQFTYFLPISPDPYSALLRFEELLNKVFSLPEREAVLKTISDADVLSYLARLLGISDFLWEDFIRLQYESLIPMLKPVIEGKRFADPPEEMCSRLKALVGSANGYEEKEKALNEYKDRQIFLLDLNHILIPSWGIRELSRGLTALAECVVSVAFSIAYEELVERYGIPRTVAGIEAVYAVLGLGKLGGAALGYASDIEILFVYSDHGATDGDESIKNYEFFERLVRKATGLIHAKSEGIFHIDLRLRPYGNAGPLACSLERFCSYYGRNGEAHSYEKLALVRLRYIAGNRELGIEVERIRDDLIYTEGSIDIGDLRELREKQFKEKCKGKRRNVKYCPGALVDLEYAVQILQVMYGAKYDCLRTPRIHEALDSLVRVNILKEDEAKSLIDVYYFLRHLINALRMLRGSARDLFLPDVDSVEFEHLARRMGYGVKDNILPSQSLQMDFEAKTALVRSFLKRHFGNDSLPGSGYGSVADLVLSDSPEGFNWENILKGIGFREYRRAYINLKKLAGEGNRRKIFSRLIVLAANILKREPDPDMALNNWERFEGVSESSEDHFASLMSQPKRLEIMLDIFSNSEYLSDTLIKNPDFFDWVTLPSNINRVRTRASITKDLRIFAPRSAERETWLNALRLFKRREILRIGTRDICIKKPVEEIVLELSELADAIIDEVFHKIAVDMEIDEEVSKGFCIFAFGKLGGRELNYSSDVDLFAVYDSNECGLPVEVLSLLMKRFRESLSLHTDGGYLYRVDFRLRPYGEAGELVQSVSSVISYYKKHARAWEVQALLKSRAIAGDMKLGSNLIDVLRGVSFNRFSAREFVDSIRQMRKTAEKQLEVDRVDSINGSNINVKDGIGGIRDVEFLVQGLQLIHFKNRPEVLEANTYKALDKLAGLGIISNEDALKLKHHYLFLRRVEHFLQIYGDRQRHGFSYKDAVILGKSMLKYDCSREKKQDNDRIVEIFYSTINGYMGEIRDMYLTLLSQV